MTYSRVIKANIYANKLFSPAHKEYLLNLSDGNRYKNILQLPHTLNQKFLFERKCNRYLVLLNSLIKFFKELRQMTHTSTNADKLSCEVGRVSRIKRAIMSNITCQPLTIYTTKYLMDSTRGIQCMGSVC